MKNIHLIPTDKPSKLLLSGFGTLFLTPPMRFKNSDTYQHMYITSDEEIKEGDWYINPRINKVLKCDHTNISVVNLFGCKKIILTTDQDLINDGVQAITDEFLEWFVKNPNCEEVKVVEKQHFEADESKRKNPLNGVYYSYKIIIPKVGKILLNDLNNLKRNNMTYVKVTYLACDYDEKFPIISADSFDNLRLALDEYCGANEKNSIKCLGFTPYSSKYPSDYEGYYEYEYCCNGNDLNGGTYIDKFRVYCIEFYPETKYDVTEKTI